MKANTNCVLERRLGDMRSTGKYERRAIMTIQGGVYVGPWFYVSGALGDVGGIRHCRGVRLTQFFQISAGNTHSQPSPRALSSDSVGPHVPPPSPPASH